VKGFVAHKRMLQQSSFGAESQLWNLLAVHAWTVM